MNTVKLYRYTGSLGVLALASEIILAIFCIVLIVLLIIVKLYSVQLYLLIVCAGLRDNPANLLCHADCDAGPW